VAPLPIPRGADIERLESALRVANVTAPVIRCDDVADAMQRARERAGPDDRILVFGSFYTVAAALRALDDNVAKR